MDNQNMSAPQDITISPRFSKEKIQKIVFIVLIILVLILMLTGGYLLLNKLKYERELISNKKPLPAKNNPASIVYASQVMIPEKQFNKSIDPFKCPSEGFCNSLTIKESSVSAKLKSGTQIKASFDGQALRFYSYFPHNSNKIESFTTIQLVDINNGVRVSYNFKGKSAIEDTANVKEGDLLGEVNGEGLSFYNSNSLVLIAEKFIDGGWKRHQLKVADFTP